MRLEKCFHASLLRLPGKSLNATPEAGRQNYEVSGLKETAEMEMHTSVKSPAEIKKGRNRNIPNGITFKMVMIILISVTIVLILATIKIYLSNQIYYESKKVNKIEREVSALKAEKVLLQQNIEALKFKNRVTDTIFILDNTEE
jgi:cell division protein FtsL